MIFKKFKPFCGSLVYKFQDPDGPHMHEASTYPELVTQIVKYRSVNQLEPIENLSFVLDNYLCGLPENAGSCCPATIKRSFMAYFKGGIALLKNLAYDNCVSEERADERAEVCVGCPHNTFPDKGAFIRWSDEMAERSIGNKKSKLHDKLGNCDICSCNMRAKVFFGGKIDMPESELKQLPLFCWQLKEVQKNG